MVNDEEMYTSSDGEESPGQPLVEMSQDCVVEWNESQHESFPLGGAKTPLCSSSISPKSSSGRHRQNKPHRSLGLEEVRRKLEEQSQRSGDRGKRTKTTRESKSPGNASGEEEINAIFDILKQEDNGLPPGVSPVEAATQRTGNRERIPAGLYRNRPAVTSLAPRRRRRQQEQIPLSNKRQQSDPSGGVSTASLCKTPPPSTKEGAFDSLLKQLTEQEASGLKVPAPSLDKENLSLLPLDPTSIQSPAIVATNNAPPQSLQVHSAAEIFPTGTGTPGNTGTMAW